MVPNIRGYLIKGVVGIFSKINKRGGLNKREFRQIAQKE